MQTNCKHSISMDIQTYITYTTEMLSLCMFAETNIEEKKDKQSHKLNHMRWFWVVIKLWMSNELDSKPNPNAHKNWTLIRFLDQPEVTILMFCIYLYAYCKKHLWDRTHYKNWNTIQ